MIGGVILIAGALFTLLASLGLYRMPDLFTKMHAVSKAGAFGGSMLLVFSLFFFGIPVFAIVIANIIFFYFTAPVAAQMIAKAGMRKKVERWKGEK